MNLRQNYELAKLTEKVLNKGLDYIVTLGSEVTVELVDASDEVLDTRTADTVENALESLLRGYEQ